MSSSNVENEINELNILGTPSNIEKTCGVRKT